ncbi:hypothetical protein [Aquimarina muelleri]|uniref:Uncharacterized protein n=1 Tax=Aquimarina muelleri TaxID=279356 RepID=A0A918JSG0_9FLAO|nr:hypothetical protein [Aquimarina muelleri]MCX2761226.1 hypothetical protein [Aquimarina muelleri]GGX09195.1 hypothetical protein GCM10007384_08790 [Aquimarina muelleri]
MKNLVFIFLFFSSIACFSKNTPYQKKIPNTNTIVNTLAQQLINPPNNVIFISMSILDLIRENTDPYKKKNEATGSWVKSTIWIKNPNWIKKELV